MTAMYLFFTFASHGFGIICSTIIRHGSDSCSLGDEDMDGLSLCFAESIIRDHISQFQLLQRQADYVPKE